MRLLLKSLKDLANYDPKRPIFKPTEEIPPEMATISTLNPARQWWKYISKFISLSMNRNSYFFYFS